MNRQEILLNLTMITIIGALGYSIYDTHKNPAGMGTEVLGTSTANATDEDGDTGPETSYDRSAAAKKFPMIGGTDLFKAIQSPTPTPPPPTPKPTETPNIQMALNAWKLLSVDKGVATIEDVIKTRAGAEDNPFEMKKGDSRPIDVGGGQTRMVTLESVDEVTNPDVPAATFTMQDTQAKRTLKMGEEAGANANMTGPAGQPGAPAPPPQ